MFAYVFHTSRNPGYSSPDDSLSPERVTTDDVVDGADWASLIRTDE